MNLENQLQKDSIKDEIRKRTEEFKAERKRDEEEYRRSRHEKEEEYREFVRQKEDEILVIEREDSPKPYTRAEKSALRKEKREREKTRRKELSLPYYSHGEELMNAISHIVGGAFAIAVIILGVFYSALQGENQLKATVVMSIYGVCMLLLYTMSSVYHFLNVNRAKKVFQILDHCTVYILIGATYVPVCALILNNIYPYNYVLLGCVIGAVVLGVALNATMMKKTAVKIVSYTLYVAVGWCIIFFYPFLVESAGLTSVILMIGGGVAYTVGAILYAIGRKKKYFHFIFHLFVLAGSALQFAAILLYLIQQI